MKIKNNENNEAEESLKTSSIVEKSAKNEQRKEKKKRNKKERKEKKEKGDEGNNRKRKHKNQDRDSSNKKQDGEKRRKTEEQTTAAPAAEKSATAPATPAASSIPAAVNITLEGKDSAQFKPVQTFAETGVSKDILDACCHGFAKPTPIQAHAWPVLIANRDIVGIAATGSGKTLAFLLPALDRLKQKKNRKGVSVLVLAPTRELACQIRDVALGVESCKISTVCLYGGVDKFAQKKDLKKGADIVVATPGRLIDLLNEQALTLDAVNYLVLDEADRMLDMGFERDIRAIIGQIPKNRQTLMFSATWPDEIRQLAFEFLNNPIKVTIGSQELAANTSVKQIVEVVDPKAKDRKLEQLLMKYHGQQQNRVIIFALYKKEAARIESTLWSKGWNVIAIHGDMTQVQRTNAINQFKEGKIPLLVATDVAARGLDIPDVEYVINNTFPLTVEDYVHRIGRTGRAGKTGVAHTFFTVLDKHLSNELVSVLRNAKQEVPEDLAALAKTAPLRAPKKKEHAFYGAHFKDDDKSDISLTKPTHFKFD